MLEISLVLSSLYAYVVCDAQLQEEAVDHKVMDNGEGVECNDGWDEISVNLSELRLVVTICEN